MWSKIFGRKSTEKSSRRSIEPVSKPLKPEDFDDVFGGPPRCVYFHLSDYFYEHMFHNPVRHDGEGCVQDLSDFKICLAGGLNSKMFRRDFITKDVDEVPGLKLKSEEFSPCQSQISDNDVYTSRINVQPTWNNSTSNLLMNGQQKHEEMSGFKYNHLVGKQCTKNFRSTLFSFSRRASSPESTSRGTYSYPSVKLSVGDEDIDDDEDDDNEINSSYFFEINPSYREGTTDEGVGVDEAIAWAKERYQSHSSSAKMTEKPDGGVDGSKSLQLQGEYRNKMRTEEEQRQGDEYKEIELMEENIKLWSSGKEKNIELLLSTLQNILWPNSGWCPIPPTNLYESSNVKKAYQKARLCLHPDKLQQRGATLLQKYVAERIFLILQDAWDAYISQDIIILEDRRITYTSNSVEQFSFYN